MAKSTGVKYVCSNCGNISASWTGRCQNCGQWNTLQEQVNFSDSTARSSGKSLKIENLATAIKEPFERISSGLKEVDNVLGGGIVPGSINLLAGQPGIGKSTILLQIANCVAKNRTVLYISGEESARQIALRATRLKVKNKKLELATSNITNDIASTIASGDYELVIVDSIQAISLNELSSAAGTVSQITNSAQLLSMAAKKTNSAIFLVGHVTKEGSIAGPKVLEHMVDVVTNLEGDRYGGLKVLRAIKNRYGATTEAGMFEMTESGMEAVENPSAILLAERQISDGSVVTATMEGSRPLLVEVQALVNTTSYGYPKRAASGIDLNRVNLLIAMLEKRTKLKLLDKDIYINVVGGIKLTEPASDLAICMAIASAAKGFQIKENAVVFGEIGLSGEIRHVPYMEKRIREAQKLNFKSVIGPYIKSKSKVPLLKPVKHVRDTLNSFLEK